MKFNKLLIYPLILILFFSIVEAGFKADLKDAKVFERYIYKYKNF